MGPTKLFGSKGIDVLIAKRFIQSDQRVITGSFGHPKEQSSKVFFISSYTTVGLLV